MSGTFDLSRFVTAQEPIYQRAIEEIQSGRKESHWMWFIFPQIAGLGSSSTARYFAIKDIDEAQAYLAHPILGARLIECCEAILSINGKTAHDILGSPDDLKLRSSMTLFAALPGAPLAFSQVLAKYYQSRPDPKTIELLDHPIKGTAVNT
jgi:uncharacterized protein (DUF1810 family)